MGKSSDKKNSVKAPKRSYRRPQLTKHGRIARITAGGSGNMQEMAGMGAMGAMDVTRFP